MPYAIKWDPLNDYTEAHISIQFKKYKKDFQWPIIVSKD